MTRETLRVLARALNLAASALEAEAKASPRKRARPRTPRKLTLTPKRRAQLKLHGRYIGSMRGLAAGPKARVKRVREQRGIEAAIALARKMAAA